MDLQQRLSLIGERTEEYVNGILDVLQELIAITEEKYSYIYETLPQKERDIEISVKEVEILLNHLIYSDSQKGKGTDGSVITGALGQLQGEFKEITDAFLNQELVELLSKTFLNTAGQDDQSFSKVGRLAKEVRETLAGLRDLALNSLIFSIRSGEEGAGFQILADRINQISSRLSREFAEMDRDMRELDGWNRDFQNKLRDFINYEEEVKSRYQEQFKVKFAKIEAVLKVICLFLTDHLAHAKTVISRVPEAMVLIQNQDIIRQNTENLIKCLRVLVQKKEGLIADDRDEILNHIVFFKKSAELSGLLLDNIEAGLEESILALERVLGEIQEEALELAEEAAYVGGFFAGGSRGNGRFVLMDKVFSDVMEQVRELAEMKRTIETRSIELSEGSKTFEILMNRVDERMAAINKEVKTMKKMKVLIKIELSRISHGSNNSMANIVDAVEEVISTVSENQKLFNSLKQYLLKNISLFEKALAGTRNRLSGISKRIDVSGEKLGRSGELAAGAVHAMITEMGDIFQELQSPYHNIRVMDRIKEMLAKVRAGLQPYERFLGGHRDDLFSYFGVEQWEEKKEDLQIILDQFTCYSERRSANWVFDEAAVDLQECSADIVLF